MVSCRGKKVQASEDRESLLARDEHLNGPAQTFPVTVFYIWEAEKVMAYKGVGMV